MNSMKKEANADPDYENIQPEESVSEVNESLQREDARDQAIHKMQNIIHKQFSFEINLKEKEVSTLNHRVHECRASLDRLRACVLAGYYGYGTSPAPVQQTGVRTAKARTDLKETNLHDIMNWKRSLPSNLKEQEPDQNLSHQNQTNENLTRTNASQSKIGEVDLPNLFGPDKTDSLTGNESRFYVKRKIIIGNTSKFILPEQRERNDRSTHKWMVYVRGPKDDGELQNFISKVWFLLHPSYKPNDLVEVCKPPFQVTRRGWGEFPVRVQLHFLENKNKRVDIIHHLKLDKTSTGLQTLGAETHVEIELDRKNFDGLSSCQPQDSSRRNVAVSAKDLISNPCSERENMAPVSSQSFDLALGQHGMAMDCDGSTVDQKGSKWDKYGSEHGVLNDHSYSTVATEKPSRRDDMKYPAPPTAMLGTRCSSPKRDATLPESFSVESDFEQELSLQKCVKLFPVVRAEKSSNKPGYCASSLEQFLGWNLGKRLAGEWQRALAMKAHIENERALKSRIEKEYKALAVKANIKKESHTLSTHFHKESLSLSTKDVMNYCRMHGFTPMLKSSTEGSILCKFCGEEMNETDVDENDQPLLAHEECVSEFEEDDVSGTYITAEEFLETLSKSECISRKHDKSPDDNGVVDVVGVTDKGLTKDPSKPRLFFLPVTAEHEWVKEIASEVDVTLTNCDIDGVHAPVTSAMLYKACTMFVENIVRKASRFTWKSTSRIPKAKCILPYHVKQALEVIPHCDFLTNKYLKVEIDTTED